MPPPPPQQTRIYAKTTFRAKDRPLHVQRKALSEDFYPHDHDFIETALVVDGEGYHCTRHGERLLTAGDLILIAPGAWHSYRVPQHLTVYNCCFGISMLTRELTAVYQNHALRRLFAFGERSLDMAQVIVTRIEERSFRRCLRSLRRMEAILDSDAAEEQYPEQIGHLLLYLCEISRYVPDAEASVDRAANGIHPAVLRCRALLMEKYAQDWTLTQLAEDIHIAPKYLVRLFHESTGMAPIAYLARIRAERASLLLVNTSLPIAEIGEKVGWPDPNYFSRRFRSMFGMSASEYRDRFTQQHSAPFSDDASVPA